MLCYSFYRHYLQLLLIFYLLYLDCADSIYTLALVSFSVGLVTEEVIQTLTNFTKEKLANKGSSTDEAITTKSAVVKEKEHKSTNTTKENDEENK